MAKPSLLYFLLAVATSAYCLNCTVNDDGRKWSVTSAVDGGNVSVTAEARKIVIVNESLPVLNLVEINCHLEELELVSCAIKEIRPGAFAIANDSEVILQEVIITGNEITDVKEGVFNNLHVRILRIPNNKIATIESGAFNNNTYLETIDLSDNELTFLDPLWFSGCTRLSEFSINKNKIEKIHVTAFQTLLRSGSVIIRLSTNVLRSFDPLLLENYDEIELLDVSNNYITELNEDLFENRTIKQLDVENNDLRCVPDNILQANVSVLNIMRNMHVRCDCLKKLEEWRSDSEIVIFYPSIICEDKENGIMEIYNANTTSIVAIPRPEFFGIPRDTQ